MNKDRNKIEISLEDVSKKVLDAISDIDNTLTIKQANQVIEAYLRFYVIDVNRNAIMSIVRALREGEKNVKKGF